VDVRIRRAGDADLPAVYAVWRVATRHGPAGAAAPPSFYHHVLATGQVWVAERGEDVVGYAGLMERGGVAFLSDLFVAPRSSLAASVPRCCRRH